MVQQAPTTAKLQGAQDPDANKRVFKAGDTVKITGDHKFKGRIGLFQRYIHNTGIKALLGKECSVLLDKVGDETKGKTVELEIALLSLQQRESNISKEFAPRDISLDDIEYDPKQPRKTYNQGAMIELADSIEKHYLLQPITVRPTPSGKYQVIFGERRCRASFIVREKDPTRNTITAYVRNMTDDEVLEIQIIENLQREDVHAIEEAHAFLSLHKRLSVEEIADRIGKSKKYVTVRLRLNDLTVEFQEIFLKGKISFEDAKLLSRATEETQKLILAEQTKVKSWAEEDWKIGNYQWYLTKANQDLDVAKFETEDATLYPEMGVCGRCFHNSAVNQLFGDVEGRICNFSACHTIKTERSYQRQLEEIAKDKDAFLVSNHHYDDESRKKVATAKATGQPVLEYNTWQDVTLQPEPIFDQFKEGYNEIHDSESPEEIKVAFDEAHKEWEEVKANYDKLVKEGRIKKALVVAGNGAGTFKNIVLTSKAEDLITNDVTGKIQKLLQKEDEAKNLDAVAVYSKAADLLKVEESFLNNDKALNKFETIGLAVLLMANGRPDSKIWLEEALGFDNHPPSRVELYEAMTGRMTGEIMNAFLRKVLAEKLIKQYDNNPNHSPEPRAVIDITRQYLPDQVKAIENAQAEIADTRSWDVQEQITKLKLSALTGNDQTETAVPLAIRTDTSMMAIKVLPEGSNGGWRKLEGKFADIPSMEIRYQELLATGKYFQEPQFAKS